MATDKEKMVLKARPRNAADAQCIINELEKAIDDLELAALATSRVADFQARATSTAHGCARVHGTHTPRRTDAPGYTAHTRARTASTPRRQCAT